MKVRYWFLVLLSVLVLSFGCENKAPKGVDGSDTDSSALSTQDMGINEWVKNAVIYEVNVRQYTPEGTFAAFSEHLPKLKELGVDILWFMPIHPIGLKNRKLDSTSLGSYYAVKDYKAVNPDFGTNEDFQSLVEKCHEMGFKVVLDWVANHSAPDHHWVDEHPEYYTKDSLGNYPIPPVGTDWWDVADLNYDEPGLRAAMVDAMKFWVDNYNIDGFRCDVAGEVPLDFWVEARPQLEKNKKLFMLAEWEDAEFYKAFDFTYGWHQHHIMNEIIKGEQTVADWKNLKNETKTGWLGDPTEIEPWGNFNNQMNFTTNHDENSWNKTVFERFGNAHAAFATMAFTLPGLPLIYSGQEAAMNKSLRFFEKDTIDWTQDSLRGFYTKLVEIKHNHPSLNIGDNPGSFKIKEWYDEDIFMFERAAENDTLLIVANLSPKAKGVIVQNPNERIIYTIFSSFYSTTEPDFQLKVSTPFKKRNIGLGPWEVQVFQVMKPEEIKEENEKDDEY
ncbi:MAG: alpha-amylase [Bacteroidia bacterium]